MPNVFSGPFRNNERNIYCNFQSQPFARFEASSAAPQASSGIFNAWIVDGYYFECANITAVTNAVPTMGAIANDGLSIGSMGTGGAISLEIGQGSTIAQLNAFKTGTSLPFYARATFNQNGTSTIANFAIGFRKFGSYLTYTSYTDYATIGILYTGSGASDRIQIATRKASGAAVITDTTNVSTSLQNFTVEVLVDGSGNVTYLIDTTGNGPLIAPTAVAAYSFTAATTVIPFIIYYTNSANVNGAELCSYSCGLQ